MRPTSHKPIDRYKVAEPLKVISPRVPLLQAAESWLALWWLVTAADAVVDAYEPVTVPFE